MDMFKSSFMNKPNESDFIPTPERKEKINPDSHSILPRYRMIEETTINKMEDQTLFFIFYFQENLYERYLAALKLKKNGWRFHKKFNVWLKRYEDPVIQTEQFEKGEVLIFDSEDTWRIKRRANFTFDYKHLEDELPTPASS